MAQLSAVVITVNLDDQLPTMELDIVGNSYIKADRFKEYWSELNEVAGLLSKK